MLQRTKKTLDSSFQQSSVRIEPKVLTKNESEKLIKICFLKFESRRVRIFHSSMSATEEILSLLSSDSQFEHDISGFN